MLKRKIFLPFSLPFPSLPSPPPSARPPTWRRKLIWHPADSKRPAYWGSWAAKEAGRVGPRRPFERAPGLDYEFASDEEWEDEPEGEDLDSDDDDDEGGGGRRGGSVVSGSVAGDDGDADAWSAAGSRRVRP